MRNNEKTSFYVHQALDFSQPDSFTRKGFTLMELLVVTALVATLLTWGSYGYRELFHTQTSKEEPRRFIDTLKFARSYAMANKKVVYICPGDGDAHCLSQDYARGWVVLEAQNYGSFTVPPPTARLVSVHHPLLSDFSVKTNVFSDFIRFSGYGRSHANGYLFFCRSDIEQAVAGVVIIRSGRIRNARKNEMSVC